MSPPRTLRVFPDAARMEAELLAASRQHAFVDASGFISFRTLVSLVEPRAGLSDEVVEGVVSRLSRNLTRVFGEAARSPQFAAAVVATVRHLAHQRVTPVSLQAASAGLHGPLAERVREFASLWNQLEDNLEGQPGIHEARRLALATERLEKGLPVELARWRTLEITSGIDVTPAHLAFFESLARACEAEKIEFRLTVPASGSAEIDVSVNESLRVIETRWQTLNAEAFGELPTSALSWLMPAAFSETEEARAAPEVEFFSAATEQAEARSIARKVSRLVRAGTPPERIAVVHRASVPHVWLRRAFAAEGIPLRVRSAQSLAETKVGALALSILELPDEDYPAEPMCQLLESGFAPRVSALCANVRKWVNEAGIANDAQGALQGNGAWKVRLGALAQRLEARGNSGAEQVRQVAVAVELVCRYAGAIPERGPGKAMFAKWKDALGELQIGGLSKQRPSADLLDARDETTIAVLQGALRALGDTLVQSGLADLAWTRREFARYVRHFLSGIEVAEPVVRSGAVAVLEAREVSGRTFDAVFIRQLCEGVWPARRPLSALFSDDECFEINRAAKAPFFRTIAREGGVQLSAHEAEDRLLLHLALTAGQRVWVSRSRVDARGHEQQRSPLLERLSRVVAAFAEDAEALQVVPALDEVTHEGDLRVRGLLETLCPPSSRQSPQDARAEALKRALQAEPWFERARRVGALEHARQLFFADETRAPTPGTGLISDREPLALLQKRVAFDAAHPLSATTLQRWANCHFQGYAQSVLRLREAEESGEDLSPLTEGNLAHEVLRLVVPRLKASGQFNNPDEVALRAAVDLAFREVAESLEKTAAIGHPVMWKLRQDVARHRVIELLRDQELRRPFPGLLPSEYEVEFGTRRAQAQYQQAILPTALEGETEVAFEGKIDRIDRGAAGVGVIDYKRSLRATKKSVLETEVQVPLYLWVLSHFEKSVPLDGVLIGLKQRKSLPISSAGTPIADLVATDGPTREKLRNAGRLNFATVVHDLLKSVRQGDVAPRPKECTYCDFKRICRIGARSPATEGMPGAD